MHIANQEAAIRERAYAIWEEEGRPAGREWDHWERASREILARMSSSPGTSAGHVGSAAAGRGRSGGRSPARATRRTKTT
jgi:hypothetical protein